MNPVEDFYQNSTILVTGGNGFLGSVLVEKLLRCFDVKRMFVLLRAKNKENFAERAKNFFNKSIFQKIRHDDVKCSRVTFVEVDYEADDMKIDPLMLAEIQSNVQIIFNIVASVKFNEKLRNAVSINLIATGKIVDLANRMKSLKSFLHISTLYSNSNRNQYDDIGERIYHHFLDYHQLISIAKVSGNIENESQFLHRIFNNSHQTSDAFPNTYTLTKHFAEKLLSHRAFYLPCGIFRPPIVISSYREQPGYAENLNGPGGIIAWTTRGVIRCIHGDSWKSSNVIPVDFCINAMITAAWDVHDGFRQREQMFSYIPIYNYIFNENNLTWGQLMRLVAVGFDSRWKKFLWRFSYFIVSSKSLFRFVNFLLHTSPAKCMDFVTFCGGGKSIYGKMYKKIGDILMSLSFFGTRQWNFKNDNIQRLVDRTKTFRYANDNAMEFDMRRIDWNEFFKTYWPGIQRHLMLTSPKMMQQRTM